jgi:diguanylate cyclase (GGDEF)-like protein
VEDDPQQASFAERVLGAVGYQVRTCEDPARFELELRELRPDLVLMDVMLPLVEGHALVRFMRQDEEFAQTPVLYLTTENQMETRVEALRSGGDAFLLKPVTPGLLVSSVASLLDKARLTRGLVEHDGLTGLLNHSAFQQRLASAFDRTGRKPEAVACLGLLDVAAFARLNERWGYPVGDTVLRSLSKLLRRRVRLPEAVGRLGADCFALLLEDFAKDEASRLMAGLVEEFEATDLRGGDEEPFRARLNSGLAELGPETASPRAWLRAAEDALREAKARRSGA